MSTFGRGIRYELKRASGNVGSTFSTVLSVPSTANYYIFIQAIVLTNPGSPAARKGSPRLGVADALVSLDSENWFLTPADYIPWIAPDSHTPYFEIDSLGTTSYSGGSANVLNKSSYRYLQPNEYIQLRSTVASQPYWVVYTQVYFGGQSDY